MTPSLSLDSRALAEAYDRSSALQLEGGQRLVERLHLGPEARVLDVGCGTGRLTCWLAARLGPKARVVGIDPLEHRIAVARSHGGTARFEVGRAEDLSAFQDASFDTVCLASVLHWVTDKARALAEARRVLRPGGTLAVTTLPDELSGVSTVSSVLRSVLRRAPFVEHLAPPGPRRGSTSTELVALALESGLELVELQVAPTESRHESGAAFVELAEASAFGNLLGSVPAELRTSLRDELAAAFETQRGPAGVVVRGWEVRLVARCPGE
ncbi:MAG: methyltransferase domain-containing protein [Myxococcaceae bacterium]|nr:methyltransferase domain-containing protein [Myxococcaceae bacterium]